MRHFSRIVAGLLISTVPPGAAMGCGADAGGWVSRPLTADAHYDDSPTGASTVVYEGRGAPPEPARFQIRSIGGDLPEKEPYVAGGGLSRMGGMLQGRVLGTFRNTYYDFPSERDLDAPASEPRLTLRDAECQPLAQVSKAFHDTLCVQGSGRLRSGMTVSFAKRDCACAEVCPRSGQRICYESLRPESFPWGRGATGRPITPLLTVAVDTGMIPLGTAIYVPEYDGAPRGLEGNSRHDGCFVAQDRGVRVVGAHIDVFTGEPALTKLYNTLVPSNRGVTVVLGSPRCLRADAPPAP